MKKETRLVSTPATCTIEECIGKVFVKNTSKRFAENLIDVYAFIADGFQSVNIHATSEQVYPEVGEWIYNNSVFLKTATSSTKGLPKVMATTDETLGLPMLTRSISREYSKIADFFIKGEMIFTNSNGLPDWVQTKNENGEVTSKMVLTGFDFNTKYFPLTDNWTSDEVTELCANALKFAGVPSEEIQEWLRINLR